MLMSLNVLYIYICRINYIINRIEKLVETGMIIRLKRLYYPKDKCSKLKDQKLSNKNPSKIIVNKCTLFLASHINMYYSKYKNQKY